mgnify:CR=1 FL=1
MIAHVGSRNPGENDVLCARGKAARNHVGNVRFRAIVADNLEAYQSAVTKIDKSMVVSSIVNQVRERGEFLKENENGPGWHVVDDAVAREKVGQSLRDLLHGKYKSSTKAKRIRRREKQNALSINLEHLVASDKHVASKMHQLFDSRENESGRLFVPGSFSCNPPVSLTHIFRG